jgi:Protein of unknown function (DUF3574)
MVIRSIVSYFTVGLGWIGLSLGAMPIAQAETRMQPSQLPIAAERVDQTCPFLPAGELLVRSELFFGLSKPNGAIVSEKEFQHFVDREVTPRFPDGLTLLTGLGQFRTSQGRLVREYAKVLLVLYPPSADRSASVEEIRQFYKQQFQQESVLRVDTRSCVSF